MFKTETIDYQDAETPLEGFCVYDERANEKKPAVLVCHDWSGKNEFACEKATKLAELGYVGFALDMFGKGKIGKTKEERMALIQPLLEDRHTLLKRILAAFDTVKKLPPVDAHKIGAIGFCFGGLCALDLARSGADIKVAVSFHGLLHASNEAPSEPIKAKVLALHGYNDPMVTPDKVTDFCNEMTNRKVDWELNIYGNAMHGFTNPKADDHASGIVYEPKTSSRAWLAMQSFLREAFGEG